MLILLGASWILLFIASVSSMLPQSLIDSAVMKIFTNPLFIGGMLLQVIFGWLNVSLFDQSPTSYFRKFRESVRHIWLNRVGNILILLGLVYEILD